MTDGMENHSDIKHILQIRSVSIYRYMEMCHAPQARIQVNAPMGWSNLWNHTASSEHKQERAAERYQMFSIPSVDS